MPKQKRSEQTRRKIIDAGARLFCDDGYHRTSSKKIAREAGIAVGSFYNHFADKKELLLEIHRLHVTKVHDMIARRLSEADLSSPEMDGRALVRSIVAQTDELHDLSPALHREITALMFSDEDFAELGRKEEARVVAILMKLLEPHRQALRVDDLEASATVVALAIEAVIHSIKIFEAPIEPGRLTDALADMVYRTLYADDKP